MRLIGREALHFLIHTSVLLLLLVTGRSRAVYCPHYCRCIVTNGLRHVACIGKGLISVDLDVPRTVQWLQLSNNSIYELRDNIFEDLGLEHIIKLNLENNALQSIGLNAFAGLSYLRHLDLSGNHLYHLLPRVFEKNLLLRYLFLSGNPFRYFTRNQPFIISDSISVLDISNCRLNYVPESSFSSLPSLTQLNISFNHIGSLELATFENMTKLTELDLRQNRLGCDPATEELMAWFESKRIKTEGSPCIAPPPALPYGPMMERMMVMESPKNSEPLYEEYHELDEYHKCVCPTEDENKSNTNEVLDVKDGLETVESKSSPNNYNPLFLMFAFVNGLIVGAALSLTFWLCSRWKRVRRSRLQGNTYAAMDYDGPPPAYNELF